MALWLDDYRLSVDYTTFDTESSGTVNSAPVVGNKWRKVEKGTSANRTFSASITLGQLDVDAVLRNLTAICDGDEPILLKSDSQNLFGDSKYVYVKVESSKVTRPPGYPHVGIFEFSGYILGVPASQGGDALMGAYWSASPVPIYSAAMASGANTKEPSWWFPWSNGGRYGLVASPDGKSWRMHDANRITVVSGAPVVTKDQDGTGILRFPTAGRIALGTHTFTDGYFSVRFRASDLGYAVSGAAINIDARAVALTGTTNRYSARITRASASVGSASLSKVISTVSTTFNTSTSIGNCFDGRWHTLTLFIQGSFLALFVDGVCYNTATDTAITAGGYIMLSVDSTLEINVADFGHSKAIGAHHVPLSADTLDAKMHSDAVTVLTRPVGSNLIGNTDGVLWSTGSDGGTPTVSADIGKYRHGTSSQKIVGSGTSNMRLVQTVTTEPGRSYVFDAWTTCLSTTAGTPYYIEAAGVTSAAVSITSAARTWVRRTITFTATSTTTNLVLRSADTGSVWWDDVSLRECVPVVVNPKQKKIAAQEAT